MTAPCLTPPALSLLQIRTALIPPAGRRISLSLSTPNSFSLLLRKPRLTALLAVTDEEQLATEELIITEESGGGLVSSDMPRPSELYVCNIPRSSDVKDLTAMFQPFGTVKSVEVSRNPDTGEGRGCAYVTMASAKEAKDAIDALDESDIAGRQMRVKFSVYMNPNRKNRQTLNTTPKRVMLYESPYKLYVGNLAWAVKPEDIYNQFSKYGVMVSTRLIQDRKDGKSRSYAFLSFSTLAERDAAMLGNGTEIHGRKLVTRVITDKANALKFAMVKS